MRVGQTEQPIFLDLSGRRWRAMKSIAVVFVLLGIVFVWLLGQRILDTNPAPEGVSALSVSPGSGQTAPSSLAGADSSDALAQNLSKTNLPVIGSGPLVRLVRIQGPRLSGVYNEPRPRELTSDELDQVGRHEYALEKYGATSQGKRLVLTFDDGPDAKYTPELLDLLSHESVTATFFVVGNQVVKHPDIVQRMAREGHSIGNHSFTHPDFEGLPSLIGDQEVNLTTRAIRAASGHDTSFFRPPYVGPNDQAIRDSIYGIVNAEKLGMTIAVYDFDTQDWEHPDNSNAISMPPFDGADHVLLLHDAGGRRESTLAYVKRLIKDAHAHGYSFVSMNELYPDKHEYFERAEPKTEDAVLMFSAQALTVWPLQIMLAMFSITVIFVFIGTFIYIVLAILQKNRSRRRDDPLRPTSYRPTVAIVIPAYNEAKVLTGCVKSLLASEYPKMKIYIVDDGSTDNTWQVAKQLAGRYGSVIALRKPNGGKASALNYAVRRTRAPVVIGIDADTIFRPDTVSRMVRHFEDKSVGAVAGMVKVGNRTNTLARCQTLEYASSIGLERSAQAMLNGIMVVPGACGAWRREAIADAGWYSSSTIAEDCDLTIGVHVAGYRVVQDNTAVAYTEVPTTLGGFAKQRFRWMFGNVQVYRKYQDILFSSRHGWLDSFVLPLAIVSTLTPLLLLPLLIGVTVANIVEGQYQIILVFAAISFCFQMLRASIGLALGGEKMRYLWLVPVARVIYGPLRIYLIYGSFTRALRGVPVGWNKLSRAGMALNPAAVRAHVRT